MSRVLMIMAEEGCSEVKRVEKLPARPLRTGRVHLAPLASGDPIDEARQRSLVDDDILGGRVVQEWHSYAG
jgi:hypothetical protein